ncbi:MAG: hypothetical protein WA708_00470 [Acidobacteriaceae bacterium]
MATNANVLKPVDAAVSIHLNVHSEHGSSRIYVHAHIYFLRDATSAEILEKDRNGELWTLLLDRDPDHAIFEGLDLSSIEDEREEERLVILAQQSNVAKVFPRAFTGALRSIHAEIRKYVLDEELAGYAFRDDTLRGETSTGRITFH